MREFSLNYIERARSSASRDLAQAERAALDERQRRVSKTSFTVITDPVALKEAVGAISGHSIIGVDTETNGLDPFRSRVRLLQVATPEQAYVFDLFEVRAFDASALREILSAPETTKIFHNAKFDLKMLLHHFGLEVRGVFDTLLASQLIGAGRSEGGHGLAAVSDRYLGEFVDKSMQVSDW